MALKKETILVWITVQKEKGTLSFSLICYPGSRKKDLIGRIHTLQGKKVKGNRLEKLDWRTIDEKTVPFAGEYLSSLSRIAGLGLFAGTYGKKSSTLESHIHKQAAAWLKSLWPDVQFQVIFDPADVRPAFVRQWMKQNQLAGSSEQADGQENELLQSAGLFAGLFLSRDDAHLTPLCDKAAGLVRLTPSWRTILPADYYTKTIPGAKEDELIALFNQQPGWLEDGTLERWMKKGLSAETLHQVFILMEEGMSYAALSKLNPQKLPAQFAQLLASCKDQKQNELQPNPDRPYGDGASETVQTSQDDKSRQSGEQDQPVQSGSMPESAALKKPSACKAPIEPSRKPESGNPQEPGAADLPKEPLRVPEAAPSSALSLRFAGLLDSYIKRVGQAAIDEVRSLSGRLNSQKDRPAGFDLLDDPKLLPFLGQSAANRLARLFEADMGGQARLSLYLIEWENGLLLAASPVLPLIVQSLRTAETTGTNRAEELSANREAIEFLPVSRIQLRVLIEWLAARKPLCPLYASSWVLTSAQRTLMDSNAYLPLHELGIDEYLALTEAYRLQTRQRKAVSADKKTSLFDRLPADKKGGAFARLPLGEALEQSRPRRMDMRDATAHFLPEDEFDRLSLSMMRTLKNLDRSLEELRPVARLLLQGTRSSLVLDAARTPGRLERMEANALSGNAVRKVLQTVHSPDLLRTFIRQSLPSSAIEEVLALLEEGMAQPWIEASLSSKMTAAKIARLRTIYPFGRFPLSWKRIEPMPEDICEQTHALVCESRPEADPDTIRVQIALFEQSIFQDMFEELGVVLCGKLGAD